MGSRSRVARGLLLAATLAALVGCGDGPRDAEQTLTVYAASSLAGAFEELAERFESEHEGVEVQLTFGGSADLVAQIDQGAPADVFASADAANMDKLVAADLVEPPRVFATNTLQLVVPADNPADLSGLADLQAPDVRLVVCAPEVPCGAASQRLEARAGVTLDPVSEEQAVADVLGKVRTGEADAGLVYVTDVAAAGGAVQGIELPEAADVVNVYPLAPLADSDHPDLAADFVEVVAGDAGRAVLSGFGFGPSPGQP